MKILNPPKRCFILKHGSTILGAMSLWLGLQRIWKRLPRPVFPEFSCFMDSLEASGPEPTGR